MGSEVTADISGMAKMIARLEYMTTIAIKESEKITAFGRFFRGSWTSSAIAPALSKPTNDQPANATATRNGPESER